MHVAVRGFIERMKQMFPHHFFHQHVIEFGAYNVNGSVRDLFADCKYVGVDVRAGEGVDVVNFADQFKSGPVDVVLSLEMLEHDNRWALSVAHMIDILKPGGLLMLTCATGSRPDHRNDCPWVDYYANVPLAELTMVLMPALMFKNYGIEGDSEDIRFWGIKK